MADSISTGSARRCLEKYYPDPEVRTQVAEIFADSIDAAHQANPKGWEVTLQKDGKYINLNLGRCFLIAMWPGAVSLSVAGADQKPVPEDFVSRFKVDPEIAWREKIPIKEFLSSWPEWEPLHQAAIPRAAATHASTTWAASHSPGTVSYLSTLLDRQLPKPNHKGGGIGDAACQRLVELVRRKYPSWSGFADEDFVKDEDTYKRSASELLGQELGPQALADLIAQGSFDEVIERAEKVATNLLWLRVPREGDFALLHHERLQPGGFANAFNELLYGGGDSSDRLEQFGAWANAEGLPNKWTFATYFLFLSNPKDEFFVKPSVTRFLLQEVGLDPRIGSEPSADTYELIVATAKALQEKLQEYRPKDLLDIQGFVWVAHSQLKKLVISAPRRQEFEGLIQEFAAGYAASGEGLEHARLYETARASAKRNLESAIELRTRGDDFTDNVILGLLPHADTDYNRKRGAWLSWAPAATDLKGFFEGAGLKEPGDWPGTADLLLTFVERCVTKPDDLPAAIETFTADPLSKGFQTGMLTPILNALQPEHFLLVNNKSRQVISLLADRKFQAALSGYPEMNEVGSCVVDELRSSLDGVAVDSLEVRDVFDMLCHWLVARKHYNFKQKFWKIAPGEQAEIWDACYEGRYIAIGWDELGDLADISKAEFDQRAAEQAEKRGWNKVGMQQAWKFSRIQEGDAVVANRGTTEVVGIGTVTGPYYFAREGDYQHRLPVEWHDNGVRHVDQSGWKRTLVELHYPGFQEIVNTPLATDKVEAVADSFLSEKAFELLDGIHKEPTRAYWTAHKEAFQQEIEEPFKKFFLGLAADLPKELRRRLELQSRLFGRFLKNDFGRGGAWDFYWGAFYPKDGKRIEDMQLFLTVNHESIEYGFSFGAYGGEQQKRFSRNLKAHGAYLKETYSHDLGRDDFDFRIRTIHGADEVPRVRDFAEWLNSTDLHGPEIRVVLGREELLAKRESDLRAEILDAFARFAPLVICATSDDPLPILTAVAVPDPNPEYPLEEVASDTGFPTEQLKAWVKAIERKGQAILYGPPGTGKTYVAEKLAKHLIGGNTGESDLVQFHPAYAYEDFMQGIRPKEGEDGSLTYPMVQGRFLEFCQKAETIDDPCVLIIDEINRANLARVFGELMYLLEYRDKSIPLAGGGTFRIPPNVQILGTMNTADRSIALVDHALRRRFAFLALQPNFDVLRRYHEREDTGFDPEGLIHTVERLNNKIADPNYSVGITFFLRPDIEIQIQDIWTMEILPYLSEYFFDSLNKVAEFEWSKVEQAILSWNPQSDR